MIFAFRVQKKYFSSQKLAYLRNNAYLCENFNPQDIIWT